MSQARTMTKTTTVLAAVGLVVVLGGCTSDEPMTLDTIGARTADAIREAGTLRFTMVNGDAEFVGSSRYDDGELTALRLETRDSDTTGPRTEWVVDGDYWVAEGEAGEAGRSDNVDPAAMLASWDWARVQEELAADGTDLKNEGSRSIDGVETVGYTITSDERIETWWIDADDRLREYEYEIVGEDLEGSGTLSAYGDDVDIVAPN